MGSGYPVASSDLLAIIDRAYTDERARLLLDGWMPTCTGDRRCMARTHREDCIITIAEQIQRERK